MDYSFNGFELKNEFHSIFHIVVVGGDGLGFEWEGGYRQRNECTLEACVLFNGK